MFTSSEAALAWPYVLGMAAHAQHVKKHGRPMTTEERVMRKARSIECQWNRNLDRFWEIVNPWKGSFPDLPYEIVKTLLDEKFVRCNPSYAEGKSTDDFNSCRFIIPAIGYTPFVYPRATMARINMSNILSHLQLTIHQQLELHPELKAIADEDLGIAPFPAVRPLPKKLEKMGWTRPVITIEDDFTGRISYVGIDHVLTTHEKLDADNIVNYTVWHMDGMIHGETVRGISREWNLMVRDPKAAIYQYGEEAFIHYYVGINNPMVRNNKES
jgi:hypothetical protein